MIVEYDWCLAKIAGLITISYLITTGLGSQYMGKTYHLKGNLKPNLTRLFKIKLMSRCDKHSYKDQT